MNLEHDPEKWTPVLGKDHAQNNRLERDDDSKKSHCVLARSQTEWAPVGRPESAPNSRFRARSDAKPLSTFAERGPMRRLRIAATLAAALILAAGVAEAAEPVATGVASGLP